MPQHIITESVADHEKYKKAKLAEANRIGYFWFTVCLFGSIGLCWWLQP